MWPGAQLAQRVPQSRLSRAALGRLAGVHDGVPANWAPVCIQTVLGLQICSRYRALENASLVAILLDRLTIASIVKRVAAG